MLFIFISILCITALSTFTLTTAFGYLNTYEDDITKNADIYALSSMIAQNNYAFEQYMLYGNVNSLEMYEAAEPRLFTLVSQVRRQNKGDLEAYFQINAIDYGLQAYYRYGTEAVRLKSEGKEAASFTAPLLMARKIYTYIDIYVQNLISIRLAELAQLHNDQVGQVYLIRLISFIGIGVMALLFIVFGLLFSSGLSRPISALARSAARIADGELDIECPKTERKDEIGTLTHAFQTMTRNIREMVASLQDKAELERQLMADEVKLIELTKSMQEAQLLNLQAQINPHFLFNTLNTISRMSMFEQAPKTVRLINSISNLLRLSLSHEVRLIPLQEELDLLNEYIHIQETRFGDRISFSLTISTDIEDIFIPLFTLQPLVENAVKHGLEPKEEGGTVAIRIESLSEDESYALLTISDNGKGFDPEIGTSSRGDEEKKVRTGIGVENVKKRLHLFFQGTERFSLSSTKGSGTEVRIIIPRRGNAENTDS